MCDSDSELVKITRAKPKSWLRRKSKDKSSKEPVAEKGNEAVVPIGSAPLSGGNVVEGAGADVVGSDRGEGTSSLATVRAWKLPSHNLLIAL